MNSSAEQELFLPLFRHIRKYVQLSMQDEEWLSASIHFREVSNKEFLLQAGQVVLPITLLSKVASACI